MGRSLALVHRVALLALAACLGVPVVHGSRVHDQGRPDCAETAYRAGGVAAQAASLDRVCPLCLAAGHARSLIAARAAAADLPAPRAARSGAARVDAPPASVDLTLAAPRAPPLPV